MGMVFRLWVWCMSVHHTTSQFYTYRVNKPPTSPVIVLLPPPCQIWLLCVEGSPSSYSSYSPTAYLSPAIVHRFPYPPLLPRCVGWSSGCHDRSCGHLLLIIKVMHGFGNSLFSFQAMNIQSEILLTKMLSQFVSISITCFQFLSFYVLLGKYGPILPIKKTVTLVFAQ